jgi:hypothetical protein
LHTHFKCPKAVQFGALPNLNGQDLANSMLVGVTEEQSAGLPPNLAEPLASFADGRHVYRRHHLFDVAHQHGVSRVSFVSCMSRRRHSVRKLVSYSRSALRQRGAWSSRLPTCGGSRPCRAKSVRSFSVNAVSWFSMGKLIRSKPDRQVSRTRSLVMRHFVLVRRPGLCIL